MTAALLTPRQNLQPPEQAAAQRFAAGYIFTGTKANQTMLAGNAVPVNLSHWVGQRVAETLDGVAA